MKVERVFENRFRVRKLLLIGVLLMGGISGAHAQVTIGSGDPPNSSALLDLKEESVTTKGLLMPRVSLEGMNTYQPLGGSHVEGMMVYNVSDTNLPRGIYYNDGQKWVGMPYANWFYMPSIVFDTENVGDVITVNLHDKYIEQFQLTSGASTKSPSAPNQVPHLPTATDLYYYVTYYDKDVFGNVSVTDSGLLTYTVLQSASSTSHINIVFVLK